MKHISTDRLHALRAWMKENGVQACVVPSEDPHGSEYVADHWKCREWLTGFDGSAGTAVVTYEEALLWTDSRYWLQAAEQLRGSEIRLMRDGAEGVPPVEDYIEAELRSREIFVVCNSVENYGRDPFKAIWHDRPALPDAPVRLHPVEFAGETAASKLLRISQAVHLEAGGRWLLMADLAQIAWTLNLRGADILYNPVFYAYLALDLVNLRGVLFADDRKFSDDVRSYLEENGIELMPYENCGERIRELSCDGWLVPAGTLLGANGLEWLSACARSIDAQVLQHLVAVKNETEQEGFRRAMLRDGTAMVRLMRWLDENPQQTELSVSEKLESLRAEGQNYCGPSFETISAYGSHAAIVHYEPTPATDIPLEPRGLLLLDSGGQYLDGTTDITRTIALGPLSDEEKHVYTLVLKGHIALARQRFPKGTPGIALDSLARQDMWAAGYDFGHGTGHGVGSNLCVHEGPQQIRKNKNAASLTPFEPGMTITDEPGIYVEGRFGVRIENVLLCRPDAQTPFGNFCTFETLTLCPIDIRPIDASMLTEQECIWLDNYHAVVRRSLMPLLSETADRQWLENATKPISGK